MFSIVSDGKSTYFCMILYVYLSKRKLYQHMILIYSQCYPPMCPNVAGQQRFGSLPNELNLHFVRGFSSQPRLVTGGEINVLRHVFAMETTMASWQIHELGIDMAKSSNFKGVFASTTGRSPCLRRCLKVGIIPLEKLGFFEMILGLSHLEYGWIISRCVLRFPCDFCPENLNHSFEKPGLWKVLVTTKWWVNRDSFQGILIAKRLHILYTKHEDEVTIW